MKTEEYKAKILPTVVDRIFVLESGYEKDGLAYLIEGFELAEVLSDIAVCDGSDIVPAGQ